MKKARNVKNLDGQTLNFESTDQVFYAEDGREVDVILWCGKRGTEWFVLMHMQSWPEPQRDYDDGYPTREQARRRAYELMAWGKEELPDLEFAVLEEYPDERDENGVCVCGADPEMPHRGMHDGAETP